MLTVPRVDRFANHRRPHAATPDTDDPRRAFLGHFEPERRGWIGSLVVGVADDGHTNPDTVVAETERRLRRHGDEALLRGDQALYRRLYGDRQIFGGEADEAVEYAEWAIEWAAQPPEERRRRRAERAAASRVPIPPGKKWTAKQRTFLAQLGYIGPELSKREASRRIDQLLALRGRKR